MKIIKSTIYALGVLMVLSSCHDDTLPASYTVGEADNRIVLQAGYGDGPSSKAGSEDNHDSDPTTGGGHKKIDSGVKLRLQVSGVWKGKNPEDIVKETTATVGAETATDSKHNNVVFSSSEQLYWDDYGTADPDNMGTGKGRDTGLTIYGAAINDKDVPAPTELSWTEQTWTLNADQRSGWSNKDFIISNNVKAGGADGTYRFDDRASGKLLEFRHAMSLITVNLTAGEGFVDGKFVNEPSVILHGFPTSGTVDITTGSVSNSGTVTDVTTFLSTPATWASAGSVTRSALVFPTRDISAIGTGADDYIAKINADGNIYYVTKLKLLAAMGSTTTMESGKNYILNITVNKTKIEVQATILDWVGVSAANEAPVINVSQAYGLTGTDWLAFNNSYDFFRSTSMATGYDEDGSAAGINPAATYTYTAGSGAWNKALYWPNHQTHYFFRGVYPIIGTTSTGIATPVAEAVTTANGNDVIAVQNVPYTVGTYPSDLAIAYPRTTGTTCQHSGYTEENNGICATTGTITMNFEYAMSKVQVSLKSSGNDAPDKVDLSDPSRVEVKIIAAYDQGRIKLSDGLHDAFVDGSDKHDYTLNKLVTPETNFSVTTLDAVVPQVLSNDVKFRITVTNSDSTTDVYEAQVNLIKIDGSDTLITEWEHGKYYKYHLDIRKTEVKVSATIKNWVEVNGSENVWF